MAEPQRNSIDQAAQPRSVLLIDDDQKLTRLLAGYLQAQGFEVSVAYDGASGIARARGGQWDLIVLDVMLPRIDGFEVLKQIRGFSSIPVLMLTGRGAEEELVAGFEGGADDYLSKTASARELLVRIRALLRRAALKASEEKRLGDARQAPLQVGALQIDLDARTAHLQGRPLALTNVELELLASLMRHSGRVRSREQLMQEVRDRRFEIFDRSIDVHVSSLRRKLGDDSRAARYIRTVRGIGYMLADPQQQAP
ncbi:MAG TPA: response regulator transcription factor [Steroidobacteraceae bacterium]|nr:response regulator transcription factor [Steroidobacteraceae bacterium]